MLGTGILQGLRVTAKNLVGSYHDPDRLTTIQYPDEPARLPENYRNFPFLVFDGDDPVAGLRCVACKMCEKECPPQCIYIVAERDANGKVMKRPKVFDIDISVCMGCGICVETCPFDSIKMDHVFEVATRERFDALLLHRDQLAKSADYFKRLHPAEAARAEAEAARKKREQAERAAKTAAAATAGAADAAKTTASATPATPAPATTAPATPPPAVPQPATKAVRVAAEKLDRATAPILSTIVLAPAAGAAAADLAPALAALEAAILEKHEGEFAPLDASNKTAGADATAAGASGFLLPTRWEPPYKIVRPLSAKFPSVVFTVTADAFKAEYWLARAVFERGRADTDETLTFNDGDRFEKLFAEIHGEPFAEWRKKNAQGAVRGGFSWGTAADFDPSKSELGKAEGQA